MNKRNVLFFIFILAVSLASAASAADGLVKMKSPYSVKDSVQRFTNIARNKGLKIFTTVDHAEGAKSAGLELRPTTLVIFGNPKVGTPFMQCAQSVAIDLPQKALVWQDADGQVWLAYNNPEYIAKRHGVSDCPAVAKIGKALSGLAAATVAPEDS